MVLIMKSFLISSNKTKFFFAGFCPLLVKIYKMMKYYYIIICVNFLFYLDLLTCSRNRHTGASNSGNLLTWFFLLVFVIEILSRSSDPIRSTPCKSYFTFTASPFTGKVKKLCAMSRADHGPRLQKASIYCMSRLEYKVDGLSQLDHIDFSIFQVTSIGAWLSF